MQNYKEIIKNRYVTVICVIAALIIRDSPFLPLVCFRRDGEILLVGGKRRNLNGKNDCAQNYDYFFHGCSFHLSLLWPGQNILGRSRNHLLGLDMLTLPDVRRKLLATVT